jgi:hypothetical protein
METRWLEAAVFCLAMMLARYTANLADFTMFLA